MFGLKSLPPISTLIGVTTHIKGNVEFEQTLRLDGIVEGNIFADPSLPSMFIVSERGKVVGQINANRIIINGEVHGPIYAREVLEVQPKARIFGDLHYTALEMHPGAIVQGRLCHDRNSENKQSKQASDAGHVDDSQKPFVKAKALNPS